MAHRTPAHQQRQRTAHLLQILALPPASPPNLRCYHNTPSPSIPIVAAACPAEERNHPARGGAFLYPSPVEACLGNRHPSAACPFRHRGRRSRPGAFPFHREAFVRGGRAPAWDRRRGRKPVLARMPPLPKSVPGGGKCGREGWLRCRGDDGESSVSFGSSGRTDGWCTVAGTQQPRWGHYDGKKATKICIKQNVTAVRSYLFHHGMEKENYGCTKRTAISSMNP